MVSKVFFIVAVFGIFQHSTCRIVREAPAAETQLTFKEIAKQADDAVDTLKSNFLEFWGVKTNEEFTELVKTQSQTYADKLQLVVSKLTEEAKANSGKLEGVYKTITDKLTETVSDLKVKNPEIFTEAEKFQESFQKSLKGVLDETAKFNTQMRAEGEGISDNVQKLVVQIYDNTLQTARTVATQVETAVKDMKKD